MQRLYGVWGGMMRKNRLDKSKLLALGDRFRIYILFGVIFIFMSLFAPRFFNSYNLTTILRTVSMNATIALGFTIVMICGEMDLSIGRTATFAAVIALTLQKKFGYGISVPIAVLAGAGVGLLNGILVAKIKINSFIVTIGTMTILQGATYTITGGNSVSLSGDKVFAISDFLAKPLLPMLPPRVLLTILFVVVFHLFVSNSQWGRNFYMVGGNRTTAWLAGINTDRITITAFILSSTMAAVAGILFAMESSAATLNMGDNSLMYVVSATIIGGTAMSGGKGGILRSVVAVLSLEMLYTGTILFGFGNEVKIFISGLILALVVLYEAYASYKHEKTIGQRAVLLEELAQAKEKI
ncbi:MAG: ABC transporter permease [Sphaerochaetaceae bacterium]|jgi:ribose transport system permease protein|nr:ABC transporter permease [Sphaerochaetaceae bacterium]